MTESERRRNRGPESWIEAAYDLLAAQGHAAVTIERLTATTEKTRGSFYHHFGSIEGFVKSLMADWQHRHTERIVRLAQSEADPAERRSVLQREVAQINASVETAIRIWAGVDAQVAVACHAVDDRRLTVLAQDLLAFAGSLNRDLSEQEATTLALIEYASLIGAQLLAAGGHDVSMTELGSRYDAMLTAYLNAR